MPHALPILVSAAGFQLSFFLPFSATFSHVERCYVAARQHGENGAASALRRDSSNAARGLCAKARALTTATMLANVRMTKCR